MKKPDLSDAIDARLTCATVALRFVDALSALEGQRGREDFAEGDFRDSEARHLVCNLLEEVGEHADRLHKAALTGPSGGGKIISQA